MSTTTDAPTLPAGYVARPPTAADAPEIFALIAACNSAVVGRPDYTLAEVADELAEPDFDPARDGWLVHDQQGRLVGWGWSCRKGDSDTVDIDAYHVPHEPQVGQWLWHRAQHRAVAIAAERGHRRAVLDVGCYREDTATAARLAGYGFGVATVFNRLFIAHDPTNVPALPPPGDGVRIRDMATDPGSRRDAWTVHQAAFADHFGFAAKSYTDWTAHLESQSSHDWSLGEVAYLGPTPVAMVLRSHAFVADERSGYVWLLAVHPHWQGRGLGRLLLRRALAADAHAGRRGTFLHVDTDPRRPALGLYLAEGMRPVQVIDAWRRIVALPGEVGGGTA
ncbi:MULTISPECIES: GNAT family N-acetyltransferase [unclassified Solwaraspora]|uniref:GNAT family N-acetyltransferase n=1 Tax=unclassified Solwaraspora TaxID=2627926 RepID=UPI00259B4CD4|nr:GNAT family N-acetyltransferase [Solwaraspora sp. WMMA2056]WJK38868.1 GNAT family N-acetyltransferase [Solwaraspora sp. WMMA2056]